MRSCGRLTGKHCAMVLLPWLFVLSGCGTDDEHLRRIVQEEMSRYEGKQVVAPVDVIGPYSPAVRVGPFLFVSGQIGLDQATGLLDNGSIEAETKRVMENLMQILRTAGYDSSHVISATVYLKNMNDYARMNLIYGGYFTEENYPARSTVGVSELPRQANVEIAVVAWKAD